MIEPFLFGSTHLKAAKNIRRCLTFRFYWHRSSEENRLFVDIVSSKIWFEAR